MKRDALKSKRQVRMEAAEAVAIQAALRAAVAANKAAKRPVKPVA